MYVWVCMFNGSLFDGNFPNVAPIAIQFEKQVGGTHTTDTSSYMSLIGEGYIGYRGIANEFKGLLINKNAAFHPPVCICVTKECASKGCQMTRVTAPDWSHGHKRASN